MNFPRKCTAFKRWHHPRFHLLVVGFFTFCALVFCANFVLAAQVTLVWDENTEPDLAGYILYGGTVSGVYPFNVDVGDQTTYTVSNLEEGQTYYFAVTAYDTGGLESAFSNEVALLPAPVPDIKANGEDGPVYVSRNENVSVTISLDPADMDGAMADWWILADAPAGWYYYDAGTQKWLHGFHVSHQGSLSELSPPMEVLNSSGLPSGPYTFYFGVDGQRDGRVNEPLFYETVRVTVSQ